MRYFVESYTDSVPKIYNEKQLLEYAEHTYMLCEQEDYDSWYTEGHTLEEVSHYVDSALEFLNERFGMGDKPFKEARVY